MIGSLSRSQQGWYVAGVRSFLPLISAFMLVLMFWTGSAAHAAEALECGGETSAAAVGHYDGDRDQVPADDDKAAPHHHNACHGHCMAMPTADRASLPLHQNSNGLTETNRGLQSGSGPGTSLRPPIA